MKSSFSLTHQHTLMAEGLLQLNVEILHICEIYLMQILVLNYNETQVNHYLNQLYPFCITINDSE